VVVAFVYSVTARPLRKKWMRSGIRSSRLAAAGSPASEWAFSWYRVLNSRNWIPVRAKISSRGTREKTSSGTFRVRLSR